MVLLCSLICNRHNAHHLQLLQISNATGRPSLLLQGQAILFEHKNIKYKKKNWQHLFANIWLISPFVNGCELWSSTVQRMLSLFSAAYTHVFLLHSLSVVSKVLCVENPQKYIVIRFICVSMHYNKELAALTVYSDFQAACQTVYAISAKTYLCKISANRMLFAKASLCNNLISSLAQPCTMCGHLVTFLLCIYFSAVWVKTVRRDDW